MVDTPVNKTDGDMANGTAAVTGNDRLDGLPKVHQVD